jgi:hypothetical protein
MNLHNVNVEVRPSLRSESGRGVFLMSDCPANKEIIYYDGYKCTKDKLIPFEHEYSLDLDYGSPRARIIGYYNPRTSHGVAQIINDFTMPRNVFKLSLEDQDLSIKLQLTIRVFSEYYQSSVLNQNTVPSNEKKEVFSTVKNLNKGDELYYHYGVHYWIEWYLYRCKEDWAEALIIFECLYESILITHAKKFKEFTSTKAIPEGIQRHQLGGIIGMAPFIQLQKTSIEEFLGQNYVEKSNNAKDLLKQGKPWPKNEIKRIFFEDRQLVELKSFH